MDKYIYDKGNGLQYELHGDYYLPCLTAPEQDGEPIEIWGQRHRRYLREHKDGIYTGMLLTGKLEGYLREIDRQAEDLFSRLVKQLAENDGITESLKARDQMAWVQRMNAVYASATEIVNNELIYA